MAKPVTWSTYQCLPCQTVHEMRGTPAQLRRQGATRCPDCQQEMRFVRTSTA